MRRVLLTSIPGAAITHVKIDGVQHEFSTIDGVKEDVADIIMNLKKVRFKLMDNAPDKVTLSIKGKKSFTAQDIQNASDQFEVLNPEEYITEVNSKGNWILSYVLALVKDTFHLKLMICLIFLLEHFRLTVFLTLLQT